VLRVMSVMQLANGWPFVCGIGDHEREVAMKTRESGMPEEQLWDSFFEPDLVLDKLLLSAGSGDVVEFGCGYGTFTMPAARRTSGTLVALDIEPEMIALTEQKAKQAGLFNVRTVLRDFVADGTGLEPDHAAYAMLFNILHAEQPLMLLREAWRVLQPGGLLGVMHWNYDPTTPRGPSMTIRPRPAECIHWAGEGGFRQETRIIDLPPYHYGVVFRK
jgi:SAM-dependent methyltransferase